MSPGRYTGTLCNRCESGRFLFLGTCTIKCEDIEPSAAFGVVTVLGIAACVICWLMMNRMTAGRFDAMDVGLLYCQMYSRPVPHKNKVLKHLRSMQTKHLWDFLARQTGNFAVVFVELTLCSTFRRFNEIAGTHGA